LYWPVTEIPGTTRDVLREQIDLDGIPLHLADTAGIRETSDLIEAEGVRRARETLQSADIVLLLEDLDDPAVEANDLGAELPDHAQFIRVANKIDLLGEDELRNMIARDGMERVWISAKTGQGMDTLRQRIRESVGASDQAEGSFSARQRHLNALVRAAKHLEAGRTVMKESQAGELLAEELRLAQQALGELTGELLPDHLLGEIFSSFCIGK
jgi:tRNA modification GTPase